MNPLTALITGLTTGGLTCLAVQGGLLIGLLAKRQSADESALTGWKRLVLPVGGFLLAKIAVYTLFGFLLGVVGEKIQLTTTAQAWLQGTAAVLMIVTGIRLIWPHWLPWLAITPPASIRRLVRRNAKNEALVAPVFLGALTILIPCGTTIAMEAAALATGNAWQATSILFAFTLGTAPLFFVIGILAKGAATWQQRLKYVTAVIVVGIGLYSFNAVLTLIDSPLAWRTIWARQTSPSAAASATTSPVINVYANGYRPDTVTVPAGQPVNLNFNVSGPLGCTSILVIPKLGLQRQLIAAGTTVIPATFDEAGLYTFTCGMGMYSGTINAI